MNESYFKKNMESQVAWQTPVTYSFSWAGSHAGKRCDLLEKQYLDCASQLGLNRAETDCKLERDDLKQCERMDIAYMRYMRMQEERQKKKKPYLDPPPYDALNDQKFKNVVF